MFVFKILLEFKYIQRADAPSIGEHPECDTIGPTVLASTALSERISMC